MKNKDLREALTEIQESLFILISIQGVLDEYKKVLDKQVSNKTDAAYTITTSQILITSCSFLEEWEKFGSLAKQDRRIIEVRKITKPALKRIHSWKDLKTIRNSVLAHGLRLNHKPTLFHLKNEIDCPETYYDLKLLMGCIYLMKNVLLRFFHNEFNTMLPYLKQLDGYTAVKPIKSRIEFTKEFDKITNLIQQELDDYKLTV